MQLKDSIAIVTGAASGLGRCFALSIARAGGAVLAVDLRPTPLAETVSLAAELPGRVIAHAADVSDEAAVEGMLAAGIAAFGQVNVLINNAGIFRDALLVKKSERTGEIRTMSLRHWQKVIDVDLTGPFLCTREFARHCVEAEHGGVIVNISSVARHGNPGQSNYSAAKAGLVADTKLWGQELSRFGIRTGAVAPGFIETPILEGMRPEVLDKMLSTVPLRRVGRPEEIFMGVRFIIECDYFTGRCIDIDGGAVI